VRISQIWGWAYAVAGVSVDAELGAILDLEAGLRFLQDSDVCSVFFFGFSKL
jgi:hypothetical protein